jgi:hypothetical protein
MREVVTGIHWVSLLQQSEKINLSWQSVEMGMLDAAPRAEPGVARPMLEEYGPPEAKGKHVVNELLGRADAIQHGRG